MACPSGCTCCMSLRMQGVIVRVSVTFVLHDLGNRSTGYEQLCSTLHALTHRRIFFCFVPATAAMALENRNRTPATMSRNDGDQKLETTHEAVQGRAAWSAKQIAQVSTLGKFAKRESSVTICPAWISGIRRFFQISCAQATLAPN